MAVATGRLAIPLMLAFIFAGCVEGVAGPEGNGPGEGVGEIPTGALVIRGVVTDVEIRPLANVSILVKPGDMTATTDESGSFVVGPVEPGMHEIIAGGAGFKEKLVQLEVIDGGENKVIITLTDPVGGQPYYETQIFVTYTFCTTSGAPCAPVNTVTSQNITPDRPDLKWSVPNVGLANMFYQVDWDASLFAGDKRFTTRNPEGLFLSCDAINNAATPTVLYFSGEGGPGFGMWVEPNVENEGGCEIFDPTPGKYYYTVNRPQATNSTFEALGTALVVDQRITNFLTFFYHLRGPPDFSAVPDK